MRQTAFLTVLLALFIHASAWGQCMYYPVSLQERVDHASGIVLGRVVSKTCYVDPVTNSINTLNIFQVDAWLKGNTGADRVGILTEGGVLGDRATIAYPSLQLEDYNEYILFLQEDNLQRDDDQARALEPDLLQTFPYADAQGALTRQFGIYHDLLVEPPMDEQQMFDRLAALTGESATTPQGEPFPARPYLGNDNKMMPIVSFSPNPTRAGTIVVGDFITILGSGFGAAAGTVFYTNADDGGATFISSGVASDNTAWADGSITNKPAARGGTGPINVNGAMTSGSNLTVNYAHLAINSNFSGFGVNTRQRYYHRNLNGAGGYYFLYNTTSGMSTNAPAVAAFERAMETWRCNTFINWFSNGTTATGLNGTDAVNVVLFDGTLSAGVLGQAVSNFSGSGSGGCTVANTVWWLNDIDIRMRTDPPVAGFPWEYGPAAPAFAEYDFESVALHELGHAHGLGHVISPGACMHFAISNGASARTLTANDIAGGSARVAYSTAATCFNPGGSGTPMVAVTPATCVLHGHYLSLQGEHRPGLGNQLFWASNFDQDVQGYWLERGTSAQELVPIRFFPGASSRSASGEYDFLDADATGTHYYRIKAIGIDGSITHSSVLAIQSQRASDIGLYPSPTDGWVTLSGMEGLSGSLVLTDLHGRTLLTTPVSEAQPAVDLHSLANGIYHWRLQGADGSLAQGRVVVSH